jgi:rod shape-determining protein MreD
MIVDILFSIGMLLAAFLGQTVALPVLGITSLAPNLIVSVVTCIALLCGPYAGIAAGALAGCVEDVFFSPGVGMAAIPLAVIGFALGSQSWRFRRENIVAPPVLAFLSHIAADLCALALLYFTRNQAAVTGAVALRCLLSAALTGGTALPVYFLCFRVYTRGKRGGTRNTS